MLYKYLPSDRVQVLNNLEIRFTQPGALNDPFEASPLIDMYSEREALVSKIESDAQTLWEKTSPKEKTPENQNILQNTIFNLKAEMLHDTSPSNVGSGVMDHINKAIGVLSLSRTFRNLLMWSHYADSHKGFVIGLDESHDFFYQNTCQGLSSCPNKVSYTTQRSITNVDDNDFYRKTLCEKPIDWAYEEEVRIFRLFTEHTKKSGVDSAGYPIYLCKLPKKCVKSIYIGAHAQPSLKDTIKDFMRSNELCADLYETKISKTRYELECEKCV